MNAAGVATDEVLKVVQSIVFCKDFSQLGQGEGGGEHTGCTTAGFLVAARVRGRVTTEHEARMPIEGSLQQGISVTRALGNRLAEQVRFKSATCYVIQGNDKVLQGYGGAEVFKLIQQIQGSCGGDMLHAESQFGVFLGQGAVDAQELSLAVHHKAVAFTMHQQGDIHFFHHLERAFSISQVRDASLTIGGDSGGVELEAEESGCLLCQNELLLRLAGEEKSHVLAERGILTHGGTDALCVGNHSTGFCYGRHEVGHDDCSGKISRQGGYQLHHVTVSEVQVHVQGRVQRNFHTRIVAESC